MRSTSSLPALVFLISFAAVAQAQEKEPLVVDKIIAKVDNYVVLRSELEGAYQSYLSDGNPPSEQAKCELFGRLIINKMLVAKAEIDSVIVSDAQVDQNTTQRMNYILQSSNSSPDQLEKIYGKPLDEIRIELRDQIREQLLGQQMQENITKQVTITPNEVKKFYGKIPTDSLPYYDSDVEIGQIVRVAKISNGQKEETKRKLNDLRARILQGENFNELAKKYSEDPSVVSNAGEMGTVGRGAMVPSYEATAFKLKPGEISQPFESPFGFHIMQLIGRRGNEYTSRHILMNPVPSDRDVKDADRFLDSVRNLIIHDSIRFEKAARELSDDSETKSRGGYFADPAGGSKISTKDIDPVVYFTIDTMKVGNISRPVVYRTDDGKSAVRIIYFKTKFPPHQANLREDWYRIQAAAMAQKKDKVLDKWFGKVKGDVFISIDPALRGCRILD